MRTQFYHNSPEIYDKPLYSKLTDAAADKPFSNRYLGLFASTQREGLEHYGTNEYRFQLAMNSTVIELPFETLHRAAPHQYYRGLRRGLMAAGVDAIKAKPDMAAADYILVVLDFNIIEFWERARWENAFYQGMQASRRQGLLARAAEGDLEALLAAFCPTLAPMGSVFWMDEYERLDGGAELSPAAAAALADAQFISAQMG